MTEFKRVFIDTAPFIYYLENSSIYMETMLRFFAKCIEENIQLVTSAITVEEYLVFPYTSGRTELVNNFKRFVEYMKIEVVNIDSDIAEQGAKIRGKYKNFKLWMRFRLQRLWSVDVICFLQMISSFDRKRNYLV